MANYAVLALTVYAVVCLGGGIQGYVTKDSMESLVAGIGSTILLAVAAALTRRKWFWGAVIGVVVCVALVGRFLPVYLKAPSNVWPALVVAVLGIVTGVLCVLKALALRRG